ncbi:outer membrane beta-barrel protein [Afipia sp. TerB]
MCPRARTAWAAACLALIVTPAAAQSLTDMLNPARGGFARPDQSALRRTASNFAQDSDTDDNIANGRTGTPLRGATAPSRIGQIPTWNVPAASGASDSGYDSLNRKRARTKPYPGTPRPRTVGPGGSPIPADTPLRGSRRPPVSASVAGIADGQPRRRPLKVDDDPFGNVGIRTGAFLTKAAVEVMAGYDTNPGRLDVPKASPFWMISPELLIASQWSRHSLTADLRGSFTGYSTTFPSDNGVSPVPTSIDRPDFTGRIAGRLDVTRETRINSELRLRIATDNPGSPNIQAGLTRYPLAFTTGGTVGVEQDFNRLQVSLAAAADRTTYQYSHLTDGTATSNADRNFDQYGGIARVSYDLMPGLKPFAEVEADRRVHETEVDRSGYRRDSSGGYAKAGTTFELTRLLTGELAAGYSLRNYEDPRLDRLEGLLTSASLVWTATGLTTVRLNATSSIDETTLPGVSGALSRDYSLSVEHAFRRWLIATGSVGFGTTDYDEARSDKRYFAQANLVYKLSRTFHIKGSIRHDWLESSIPGASSRATVVMLGIRVQR